MGCYDGVLRCMITSVTTKTVKFRQNEVKMR